MLRLMRLTICALGAARLSACAACLLATRCELAACKTLENAKSWSLRTRGNDPGHEGDATI